MHTISNYLYSIYHLFYLALNDQILGKYTVHALFIIRKRFPEKWSDYLIINWRSSGDSKKAIELWRCAVLACAWAVWKERNCRVFDGKCSKAEDLWEQI